MTSLSPSLRKKKAHRATAPAKDDEQKAVRKPAYLKRKMSVSQPGDPEEQEADQVAREVARAPKEKSAESAPGAQETKEMINTKPVPSAQRLLRRLNRTVARAAKPGEKEEEQTPAVSKARRAKKPEEEKQAQPRALRAPKPEEEKAQKLSRSVETEEPKDEQVKRTLHRATAPAKNEKEKAAPKLFQKDKEAPPTAGVKGTAQAVKPEEQQKAQTKAWRAEDDTTEQQDRQDEQAAASAAQTQEVAPSIEERIEQTRGSGTPLPDHVLQDMEKQFGASLSHVVIHNDAKAAELCKELNARAFTVGNDIYFAPGEYAPDTDQGRELLAHELAHAVQQHEGIQQKRKIARVPTGSSAAAGSSFDVTEPLEIPPIKSRHAPRYQAMARAGTLKRPAGSVSDHRSTAQVSIWMENVRPDLSRIPADQRPSSASGYRLRLNTGGGVRNIDAPDEASFLNLLKRPTWNGAGADTTYQVDHIVEHQLGGADAIDNMELLDAAHNGSVGSSFRGEIRDAVNRTINARPPNDPSFNGLPGAPTSRPTAADVLANRETRFRRVDATGGHERRRTEGSSTFWSRNDIQNLAHVLPLLDDSQRERQGTATVLSILSPTGGLALARIQHPANANAFPVPRAQQSALSGFRLQQVQLNNGYNTAAADSVVGSVSATLDLGSKIRVVNDQGAFPIDLMKDGNVPFAVRISANALSNLPAEVDLQGASPVTLNGFTLTRGLGATALLRPSHPLLEGIQVPGRVENGRLGIFHTFDAASLARKIPLPGVNITDATVTLGFDGENLSVGGDVQFAMRNFGEGSLSAELDSQGNFGLAGRFRADTRLFDQAELQMGYRNPGGFSISGTLAITSPDKIKGIRSAAITASYNAGTFSATGTVEPDIPGIQQAGLTVAYSEEAGLTIGGNLQLASNPAIRSGAIDVTVNKRGDDWKVRATGTAQPAIPGVDSQLTVSYDDGAFTAEFRGGFRRGRLSGTVTVGATNRAIGEDGQPSGDPMPGGALNIYGSGSATIQIASWLQGTAGIRFDPNGEVTVSGEISIPSNVEIFARREISKTLLDVSTNIPIIPGIVAEIGGSLTASAGIGPGVLDELRLGITYNPAHEENTHVTGRAHLRVPADAGLRLAVRAGIGLGIPGVSVTGGLEIGGTLGIEGAAEAGVDIDWTPATGLDLTADLHVYAQPAFTFDISGYVRAKALFWEVYSNRWTLASYRFGSDYRFGIRLPVHYHEGQPFNISLDDVQFEVPDISPSQILSGLIDRIA